MSRKQKLPEQPGGIGGLLLSLKAAETCSVSHAFSCASNPSGQEHMVALGPSGCHQPIHIMGLLAGPNLSRGGGPDAADPQLTATCSIPTAKVISWRCIHAAPVPDPAPGSGGRQ